MPTRDQQHDFEPTEPTRTRTPTCTGDSGGPAATGVHTRGAHVSRYVVLNPVGAGAMGTVMAAYDPTLDRKIALKLLTFGAGERARYEARLRREAQALALLDHANVVRVYDVGVDGQQLFVAMEFVAGVTLREWMGAGPHAWSEVLARFVPAGRGLAAAHAAGILHRDFKPDNAMSRDDGQVLVLDFGLARALGEDPRDPEPSRQPASSALAETLTRTGAAMGTPAYMSPEQLGAPGTTIGAASDQFSFCVALFEALHGWRPFSVRGLERRLDAISRGEVGDGQLAPEVPPWLHAIVLRGLAPTASARWPSMDALLDALTRDPRARRRQVAFAGGLALTLAGAAWLTTTQLHEPAPACSAPPALLDGVWGARQRAAVHASFAEREGLAAAIERNLDDYAAALLDARRSGCEAEARGQVSRERFAMREGCLDRHELRLAALADHLGSAELSAAQLEAGLTASEQLPSLTTCSWANLRPGDGASTLGNDAHAALERELAWAEASASLGDHPSARDHARAVLQTLHEGEASKANAELEQRARLRVGLSEAADGNSEHALPLLEQVFVAAVHEDAAKRAALAAQAIVDTHLGRGELERARAWTPHAEAWSRASGDERSSTRVDGD